jgi:hypothetical protein
MDQNYFINTHVGGREAVEKEGSTDRKHLVVIRQWKKRGKYGSTT